MDIIADNHPFFRDGVRVLLDSLPDLDVDPSLANWLVR
jgi:hypothetical protein